MKETNSSRRDVLRGAMAVGASLFIPGVLFGCDTKKGANPSDTAPVSPPASSVAPAAPAETGKATQASVQYQAQPKGEQKCNGCMHFSAESNTCQVVAGQISPEGWCSLWAKKV